jgi:excisionase family DNA binding protein
VIDEALLELLRPLVREIVRDEVRRDRDQWRWASVEQAAERLDLSKQAIYMRVHRKQLPARRLDGKLYIDMRAVDALIDAATLA